MAVFSYLVASLLSLPILESFWLFGEPLKKLDLLAMLLQKCVAGGGQ